jgi:hypothetical protein
MMMARFIYGPNYSNSVFATRKRVKLTSSNLNTVSETHEPLTDVIPLSGIRKLRTAAGQRGAARRLPKIFSVLITHSFALVSKWLRPLRGLKRQMKKYRE